MHVGVVAGRGADRARAHDGLPLQGVGERLDAGAFVRRADAGRAVGAGEKLEFGRIEQRLRALFEQWRDDHPGKHRPDRRAVLGRHRIDVRCGAAAAGAGLVLDHDRRLARNEAGQMPRNGAGIDVVTAADVAADDQFDGLAGIEVGRRRGAPARTGIATAATSGAAQPRSTGRHGLPPACFFSPKSNARQRDGTRPVARSRLTPGGGSMR